MRTTKKDGGSAPKVPKTKKSSVNGSGSKPSREMEAKGLDANRLDKLWPDLKQFTDMELTREYNKIKGELEAMYLEELDKKAKAHEGEILEKSQFLDSIMNEMYRRGIV